VVVHAVRAIYILGRSYLVPQGNEFGEVKPLLRARPDPSDLTVHILPDVEYEFTKVRLWHRLFRVQEWPPSPNHTPVKVAPDSYWLEAEPRGGLRAKTTLRQSHGETSEDNGMHICGDANLSIEVSGG